MYRWSGWRSARSVASLPRFLATAFHPKTKSRNFSSSRQRLGASGADAPFLTKKRLLQPTACPTAAPVAFSYLLINFPGARTGYPRPIISPGIFQGVGAGLDWRLTPLALQKTEESAQPVLKPFLSTDGSLAPGE